MSTESGESIRYVVYSGECDLPLVSTLIEKELSEPYSIYTYRYFLNQWPDLCFNVRLSCQSEFVDCLSQFD
jgi:peptide alpha-N-acetyltransferase